MKEFTFQVTCDNKAIFNVRGDWGTLEKVKEFVTTRLSVAFTLTRNKTVVTDAAYPTWSGGIHETIKTRLFDALWQSAFRPGNSLYNANVGDSGKSTLNLCGIGVVWECVSNRRSRRPKHVIAAQKAVQAAKRAKKQAERAKWQAEADQRTLNIRKRIREQVDHAFVTGKSGTEPASKYITCQECHGPAAVVCLNQPLAPGASVLDEDTIVGALCAAHIQQQPWGYYSRYAGKDVHKIPCAKLEFFYDGVRQIAIKPEPVNVNVMPTRDQMDEYRKKIGVFTPQLPATPGVGSVQRMRAFITKMSGTAPQHMTVAQWEQTVAWFDDYAARHGMAGVIAHINNALGDMP